MTDRESQRRVEQSVAELVLRCEQVRDTDLGALERQDAHAHGVWSGDFFADGPDTEGAIEITELLAPKEQETLFNRDKFQRRLNRILEAGNHGHWRIELDTETQIRLIEPFVMEYVKTGTQVMNGGYSVRDLEALATDEDQREFVQRTQQQLQMGLRTVVKTRQSGNGSIITTGGSREMISLEDDLLQAINDNKTKLGEARPRRTYLATLVTRWDRSTEPSVTPVPTLPHEIDTLYVVIGSYDLRTRPNIWIADRDANEWTLMTMPIVESDEAVQ